MKLANAQLLVGRTIVAVDLQPFDDLDNRGRKIRTCYEPRFILDNGARVTFSVDEIDCGDGYGVRPLYHPATVRSKRPKASSRREANKVETAPAVRQEQEQIKCAICGWGMVDGTPAGAICAGCHVTYARNAATQGTK